jgi:alpha-tubulin suppressor-like RCC1 family protein
MQDPELDTWGEFIDLLTFCKENNMNSFDMMDCNIAKDKNWLYVITQIENKINININASENETGNLAMSGDWILERGNVNLIGTYFTEKIKEYKYTLGGGSGDFTIIINENNEVYGCGDNTYGQLGNSTASNQQTRLTPMDLSTIPSERKVIKSATGVYFTIVLLDDGTVYGCGYNQFGQLGDGTTGNGPPNYEQLTLTPMLLTNIPSGRKIVNIACGGFNTLVLLDDGTVYGCGNNGVGQLGDGTTGGPNNEQLTLTPMDLSMISLGRKVINIACGSIHTIILLDDGTVYGCGDNEYGQLGDGNSGFGNYSDTLVQMILYGEKAINIACGSAHTIVLLNNGYVYACGNNQFGQLGDGNSGFGNYSDTLVHMQYYNNNYPIPVTDALTKTFATIFFNPSTLTKIYDGFPNLILNESMYEIYTYNPLQPTININSYIALFNNSNVGINKALTIIVNELSDNMNNTDYVFVIPYTTTGIILEQKLSQYITRYTPLSLFSRLEVRRTNTKAYVVIGYKNTNIIVSVFLQNL